MAGDLLCTDYLKHPVERAFPGACALKARKEQHQSQKQEITGMSLCHKMTYSTIITSSAGGLYSHFAIFTAINYHSSDPVNNKTEQTDSD